MNYYFTNEEIIEIEKGNGKEVIMKKAKDIWRSAYKEEELISGLYYEVIERPEFYTDLSMLMRMSADKEFNDAFKYKITKRCVEYIKNNRFEMEEWQVVFTEFKVLHLKMLDMYSYIMDAKRIA